MAIVGILFRSPYHKDHSILDVILRPIWLFLGFGGSFWGTP